MGLFFINTLQIENSKMKRFFVNSINDKYFQDAWELYLNAFPIDERRDLEMQEKIFRHEDYFFEVIIINGEFIGFLSWWKFDGLSFIEHFATLEKHRGKGYGKTILQNFLSQTKDFGVLEVEPPNTDIDQRRIQFYERLGWKLNSFKYFQLPLRKNGLKVELMVMSYPQLIDVKVFEKFEKDFKEKCYDGFITV